MIKTANFKCFLICGLLAGTTVGFSQDALYVHPNGNVGIGTNSPQAALHVRRSNGTASILVQETQPIQTNVMFIMRHNGNAGFMMENSSSGDSWEFRLGGSGGSAQFMINRTAAAGPEFSVFANGNIRIKGSYLTGSSEKLKQDFTTIQPEQVLQKLNALPLYEWSYRTAPDARHFGPTAEDFHEIFNLAGGGEALAATDVASLAVAGIQAINKKAENLERENQLLMSQLQAISDQAQSIERENQALNDRLNALEAAINSR